MSLAFKSWVMDEQEREENKMIEIQTFIDEFYRKFWEVAYSEYYKKHQVLKNYPKHRSFHFKLQKTLPTEGYHVWHSEDDEMIVRRRLLFFILYLNDIEEGGETEFLYFKKSLLPTKSAPAS